ncbi:MAG TPA: GNAT family N-acetyltransferase [Roseiarcus sp.]|nr:GNAT family N-acetyltransferase [Roseiarcus sp.]
MRIEAGDLADPRLLTLLAAHLAQCRGETAAGSAHALDVTGLAAPDIDVFAGFDGETLVAAGALKRLGDGRGEVKSMHTSADYRRSGAGAAMLAHIVSQAVRTGLKRLSLETGSWDFFHPARRLYRRFGFRDCPPFSPYKADRNSLFMTLNLGDATPLAATRMAAEADLAAILAIYNAIIATSTAVYRDDPVTLEERTDWLHARQAAGFPTIVAERGGEVLGFASYGQWRGAFPGYRHSVEHSVHVGEAARGLGLGAALMGHLLDLAREAGVHVMVGAVDADNAGSLRFHGKLGFTEAAHFHEVGRKFGRWLDLVFVEKVFPA